VILDEVLRRIAKELSVKICSGPRLGADVQWVEIYEAFKEVVKLSQEDWSDQEDDWPI
jgi:hypothetical protein